MGQFTRYHFFADFFPSVGVAQDGSRPDSKTP